MDKRDYNDDVKEFDNGLVCKAANVGIQDVSEDDLKKINSLLYLL